MMLTRPLGPIYSEGLPLPQPLTHNPQGDMPLSVGQTPTLNLPAPMVMTDPSDRLTWAWDYQFGLSDYSPFGVSRDVANYGG